MLLYHFQNGDGVGVHQIGQVDQGGDVSFGDTFVFCKGELYVDEMMLCDPPSLPLFNGQESVTKASEVHLSGSITWDDGQEVKGEFPPVNIFVENINGVLRGGCARPIIGWVIQT